MYKALTGAIVTLGLAGTVLAVSGPANADSARIRVDYSNVAFGYQDGYWDRDHRWHHWRNHREMRDYRNAPGNQYSDYRHDRDDNNGWRGDLSVNVSDVASGYQDGYWDHSHQWHHWRDHREMRDYRNAPGNQYNDYRHDRADNNGWQGGVSINVGDVAFAYQDGYWDHNRQWHQWRSEQEMREYRNAPGNQYNDYRHDRDQDQGWHR